MNEIRQLIKKFLIKEDIGQKERTQSNFDWHTMYPNNVKSAIETDGDYMVLYHFGTDKGSGFLNPNFFGTQSATADAQQWTAKRTFFYIHKEDKEPTINGQEFKIQYLINKIYPFNFDPYYFYEDIIKEKQSQSHYPVNLNVNDQVRLIGEKVIKAGFDGMIVKWGNTYRVDMFVPVKVE